MSAFLRMHLSRTTSLTLLGFTMVSALLYGQITAWQIGVVGMLLLAVYLGILTHWWREIFTQAFRFEKGFASVLLSLFGAVLFVSSIEAIVLALYTTTAFLTWCSLVVGGVVTFVIRQLVLSRSRGSRIAGKARVPAVQVFPRTPLLSWVYVGLWVVTFVLLFRVHTTEVLFSPWQTLHTWVLPLMFLLTALLGVLIFSKQKTTHVLVLVLLHSVLIHLYLPLSHTLPWGGDVWRHMAVESQLSEGEIIQPVLFGTEARWREMIGVDVPEVFLIPQKYSYGQFWSLAVIANQVTQVSLQTINIWLMPLLWSLIFPLLLFRIGRMVTKSWRGGLLFAWLSFLAFPLQVLGAITLPVSLSVLSFFFVLMLWLQYLGRQESVQRALTLLFVFLMIFGYVLGFVLMVLILLATWLLGLIHRRVHTPARGWLAIAGTALLGILAIPVLEFVSEISHLPGFFSVVGETKRAVGQLFGWYFASGIRPHDIASGNLLFNHTPTYAFVSSIFTVWRWWVIPFMVLFWSGVVYGLFVYIKEKQPVRFLLPAWLCISLFGGYKIGWFFLEGDRLFSRRLDPFVSTLGILFFCIAVIAVFMRLRFRSRIVRRSVASVLVIVLSWFAVTAYASGPDMRSVSVDEYAVAEFVHDSIDTYGLPPTDVCVLADTWVLLPLEAMSAGDIVGGNFPIDYQFGQHERVGIYESLMGGAVGDALVRMRDAVDARMCALVLPSDDVSESERVQIEGMVSESPTEYSGFLVWFFSLPDLNLIGE